MRTQIKIDFKPGSELVHEGKRLLWINKTSFKASQVSTASAIDWEARGCFALGGEKPELFDVVYPGRNGHRAYIDLSFIKRYVTSRNKMTVPTPRDPNRIFVEEAIDLGFPLEFLMTYSAYKSPRKGRNPHATKPAEKPGGISHPHLHRPIKTGLYWCPSGLSGHWRPWFWMPDLVGDPARPNQPSLLNMPVPAGWISTVDIKKLSILATNLMPYVRKPTHHLGGRTMKKPQYFPVQTRRGQRTFLKHFWKADVDACTQPKVKVGYRVWIDPATNERWLPEIEFSAITGYKRGTHWEHKNVIGPWGFILDGLQKVLGIKGEKPGGTWVYRESQAENIRRFRLGIDPVPATNGASDETIAHLKYLRLTAETTLDTVTQTDTKVEKIMVNGVAVPKPAKMPRTPDKGGVDPLSGDAEALRYQLLAKYEANKDRRSLKDFCDDEGISVKAMRGYMSWQANRIRRQKQAVNKPPVK